MAEEKNKAASEDAKPEEKPKRKGPGGLVKAEVRQAIAFGGKVVRPKVDERGKVTSVIAYVPENVVAAHPDSRVAKVGEAPPDAKVGQIVAK